MFGGMKMINISNEVKELVPNMKIGAITYENITVAETPQMLRGRLQLFQESLKIDMETKGFTDFPGLKEWRSVFKSLGIDHSKYRPSSEALYRRVKKDTVVMSGQSAVDVNNFFSLQYEIPIGIYDANNISGDIQIQIGSENSGYDGLNGRYMNMKGKLISEDAEGPFGSPIVDSKKTMITEKTKRAVQIVYLTPSMDPSKAEKLLESMAKMFTQVHSGEGKIHLITP
jgi:DNA/RNA-binding domain of Phe-tRNA-synthetase-like protein